MRKTVYTLLDADHTAHPFGRTVDIFLITLITLNVTAVVFESMPDVYAAYGPYFDAFEIFSVGVFTIEYALRVWSSIESDDPRFRHPVTGRLKFMMTPLALIDLIVLLPFYLSSFIGVDLRMLRALRLLRAFRLTRYASSMNLLLHVLRNEAPVIAAAMFVLLMMIVVAASITYLAEHSAQPEAFASIPHALWWAVVTMTTIGYGDVVPHTLVGRICASVIGVISVGMVALPAGILASGFNEALHERRRTYGANNGVAWQTRPSDDPAEDRRILQEDLGLDELEASKVINAGFRKISSEQNTPDDDGSGRRVSKFG
jgi:voltage-gated potassium channel